jgi:hypothetical protein
LVTQIYNRKLKLQNKSENIFEVLKFEHKKSVGVGGLFYAFRENVL